YPNGDHAGAAHAKVSELSRPPAQPPAPLAAPPPVSVAGTDQARPQSTMLAVPPAPSAQGSFDGQWEGDAPFIGGCGQARIQFQVTGNRISGTGATAAPGVSRPDLSYSTTVTGTIGPDGVGTIEWRQNGARGTIKFTGDRFEA